MEYYSAIKKKEIIPFATTWIDLENIMLSEISQVEKGFFLRSGDCFNSKILYFISSLCAISQTCGSLCSHLCPTHEAGWQAHLGQGQGFVFTGRGYICLNRALSIRSAGCMLSYVGHL